MIAKRPVRHKTSSSVVSDRWDLTHLVKNPLNDLERHLEVLDAQVVQVESARPRLQATMAISDFRSILTLTESIAKGSARLGAFAYLWFSEDTKNTKTRSFKSQVEERLTAVNNRLLFLDLWWQGVDSENAARLMAERRRPSVLSGNHQTLYASHTFGIRGEDHQCEECDRPERRQHTL